MKGEADARCLSFFRQPFDEKMMNAYHAALQCFMLSVHRIIVSIAHHRFYGNTVIPVFGWVENRILSASSATADAAHGNNGLPLDNRMSVSGIGENIGAWRKLQELRSMPNGKKREHPETHPVWIGREQVCVSGVPKPPAPQPSNSREGHPVGLYSIHSKLR